MTTITFSCAACGQVLRVGADNAGKRAQCVKCGAIVAIPASSQAMSQAVQPSSSSPSAPPPPARNDFDFVDDPGPRRSRGDDDFDIRDEPAPRRSRDAYEEEQRRRRRDEYEEDYDRPPRGRWGDWSKVGVGMTLHAITGSVLAAGAAFGALASLLLSIAALVSPP